MNEETTKALTNLAKMFGSDRVLTSQEIDKVLNGILKMLVENKKETEALNVETKAQVEKLLNKFLDKYAVFVEDMKTLEGDVSDIQSEMLKKVENKISEVTYLLEEAKKVNVKEEKLELDDIVQAVMENITLPEVQEMMEISGERIIDLINETANTDENKISWFKIKDIPEFFTTPQTKKGKLKEGGMSPTVLRQAVDLDHSTRADGYAIVWDEANGRHKYAAAGGGGGGSGTVNSGTQYRLAYYATTGTAVSQAAAITGARVLVSDTNGVPTHSTVTTTTLGYLDATSSIQTQLDSKLSSISGTSNRISVTGSTIDISAAYVGQTSITTLGTIATGVWNGTAIGDTYISSAATWNAKFDLPSLTAGSVLFSNGTTIAQDNTNFFWDNTNNRLGIGTSTPARTFHVKGSTSGGDALVERSTASTTGLAGTLRLKATSTGDMADTFGTQLSFVIEDDAGVENNQGAVTFLRNGADGTSYFQLYVSSAGTNNAKFKIDHNGVVSPATNDGGVLGSSTLQWSDMFLAEGGVINWDNGDLTLTQSGNSLTLAGGNLVLSDQTASTVPYLDASKNLVSSAVTPTELGYLSGVTSAIQTQLNAKQGTITTGTTSQYFRGDLSLATFPTALSSFTNDSGYITASSTDTLTNKTLTAPKFADLGFIADANGNEMLIFDTTASAVNEITFVNAATTTAPQIQATGGDTNIDLLLVPKGTGIVKGELKRFMVRLVASDTDQATGTAIGGDYRISNRAITVKAVGSYCDTAGTTGTYTVDINEAGTTIMATNKITVDSTEKSSETAATPPAVTDAAIAADAIITFDVDAVQTTKAKGLVVWIDYVYA